LDANKGISIRGLKYKIIFFRFLDSRTFLKPTSCSKGWRSSPRRLMVALKHRRGPQSSL